MDCACSSRQPPAGFTSPRTAAPALLVLALIHGINGLRVISLDYIRRPGVRIATNNTVVKDGDTIKVTKLTEVTE